MNVAALTDIDKNRASPLPNAFIDIPRKLQVGFYGHNRTAAVVLEALQTREDKIGKHFLLSTNSARDLLFCFRLG